MTVLVTTKHMEEADLYFDRVSLMHQGKVQATESPARLKALPGPDASLEDVFRHFTGGTLGSEAAILGVSLTANPFKLLATAGVVVLGSAFFACLSITIAGIALNRDRLMGIGQAITMPLFFSSNALYPTRLTPGWLQAISRVNPLSYEVDALRGLLIGVPTTLWLDVTVLVAAAAAGVIVSSALLPRLAK